MSFDISITDVGLLVIVFASLITIASTVDGCEAAPLFERMSLEALTVVDDGHKLGCSGVVAKCTNLILTFFPGFHVSSIPCGASTVMTAPFGEGGMLNPTVEFDVGNMKVMVPE